MEIIKRAETNFKFEVTKPFIRMGKIAIVGQEIEINDPSEATGLCRQGRIKPCLPKTGIYIALIPFCLPGQKEKFECKAMDLVELKAEDALRLMLQGIVIPKDDQQWRPNNRRLRKTPDRTRQEHDALAQAESRLEVDHFLNMAKKRK